MEVREFDEFVSRQQAGPADEAQVNWDQERDEWLGHLDALYRIVESMLSKYISSGTITIGYKPVDLNEEDLGSYTARQMILRIGRQEVNLVPARTNFLGFKGLVDVNGRARKATLVLTEIDRHSTVPLGVRTLQLMELRDRMRIKDHEPVVTPGGPQWVWRIMGRPPVRELFDLNDGSFFQLIMEVTNG